MEKIIFKSAKVEVLPQSREAYVNWCDDVVVSINYVDESGCDMYFSVYQQNDMPCFYLSTEDIFDQLLRRRQYPLVLRNRIQCFYGFMLDWYENIYPALYRLYDSPYSKLIRLLCYLAREKHTVSKMFVLQNLGKLISDIDIPTTDIEEMFLNKKLEA